MNDDSAQPPSRNWLEKVVGRLFQPEPKNREELVTVLRSAQSNTVINSDALPMMEGVLQVSDMQVRDIMIPRSQMVLVNYNDNLENILNIVTESNHSRFPVVGDDKDDIEGVLLAKELLRLFLDGKVELSEQFKRKDILRPAVMVPESKRLDVLLKEFRISRNHMAIVVDEYGGVAGLVTIEDVLEQIVGDIEDEYDFDDEDDFIKQIHENEYTIKAQTEIEDFNSYFGCDFAHDEFDTIGGYVVNAFGHVPKRGEEVNLEPFLFTVLHSDNRRLNLLRVKRIEQ